jgi:branched-chain amino acid transport system ATP-binding protein
VPIWGQAMLSVEDLTVTYQELRALQGISMNIPEGSLVALIGSNGAGKTTFLNTLSGLKHASKGSVFWNGDPILGLAPDRICQLGIIQVPEGRKLFARMTVEENLDMGAYLPGSRAHGKKNKEKVFGIFDRLAERRRQLAGSLSGGEQQMVAVARALMAQPRMLMLDEPSLGLAPIVAAEIFRIAEGLNADGMTILIVSQEVLHALSIAGYTYVLETGRIILEGKGSDLLHNPQIKESYLGL